MISVITRGLPGSGKSTLAKDIYKSARGKNKAVYSTDDYFIDETGEYRFNGKFLSRAHKWNQSRFQRALDLEYNLVVADNTHTQFWEMVPYIEMTLDAGYYLIIAEPRTSWKNNVDDLVAMNTHKVPRKAIERMKRRWQSTEDVINDCIEKYGVTMQYTALECSQVISGEHLTLVLYS